MGYVFGIPANQLGGFENLWNIREYGLRGVWDKRESTVRSFRATLSVHGTHSRVLSPSLRIGRSN